MALPSPLVEASGLVKRYGAVTALSGLDLRVMQGEVYGLLGPNGAGKTTTLRILRALFGASRMIAGVVPPTPQGSAGTTGVDYSFPVRNPLSAYVPKDERVASRNPATGFLFALPIFEIFAVVTPLTGTPIVRVAAILAGAQVGGGFALFIAFLLVTAEDMGVERRTALPLSEAMRTLSKAVVSLPSYLPVPLALTAILMTKASTFGGAILIPFAIMGSVGAACVVEVLVLRLLSERGWGAAGRFAIGIGSGEAVLVFPAVVYTFEFLLYASHQLSLDMLTASVVVELVVAILILSRLASTRRSGPEELGRGASEVSRNE